MRRSALLLTVVTALLFAKYSHSICSSIYTKYCVEEAPVIARGVLVEIRYSTEQADTVEYAKFVISEIFRGASDPFVHVGSEVIPASSGRLDWSRVIVEEAVNWTLFIRDGMILRTIPYNSEGYTVFNSEVGITESDILDANESNDYSVCVSYLESMGLQEPECNDYDHAPKDAGYVEEDTHNCGCHY